MVKGQLKSFLDEMSKGSISTASKKPMAPTRSGLKIRRNFRIPENCLFYPMMHSFFFRNVDQFSFIECTIVWDISFDLLIVFILLTNGAIDKKSWVTLRKAILPVNLSIN